MIVKGIEIIHQEMLKILTLIDEICAKEGLQYFIDGGSSIGAIRHQGFIPWDDDIDISMLKKDYLKLTEILQKDNRFSFYFDDFEHHCCGFLFIDSVWWQASKKGYFPKLYPIKLDIRPLNVIKNEESEIQKNLLSNTQVSSVEFQVRGRTLNFVIKVKNEVTRDAAKQIAEGVVKYFKAEELKVYSIEVLVMKNDTNLKDFPINATKQYGRDSFSWTKDR